MDATLLDLMDVFGYLVHELPALLHHLPVHRRGLLRLRRLLVRLEGVLHQPDQAGAPPRVPGHSSGARCRLGRGLYGCQSGTQALPQPAWLKQRGRFHRRIRPERLKSGREDGGASLAEQLHPRRNHSAGFRTQAQSSGDMVGACDGRLAVCH